MGRIFGLYRRLVAIRIRAQMQDRSSFLLETLSTVLVSGVTFVTLALVIQRFEGIGGWSLGEIAFLYGLVEVSFGLMDMIFSGFDPRDFGNRVRLGTFDQMLLRPVDITLQVFSSEFIVRRLGRIAQGAVVLAVGLHLVEIEWTAAKVLYLPLVMLGQIAFFGSLFIIGSTITFWTVESIEVINIFTYGGAEMMSYPMHIYPDWLRRFFTYLLPAIFLNYYPALYFLNKPDPFGAPGWAAFLSPLVGAGMLALSLAIWRVGIWHYQSTGT